MKALTVLLQGLRLQQAIALQDIIAVLVKHLLRQLAAQHLTIVLQALDSKFSVQPDIIRTQTTKDTAKNVQAVPIATRVQ